MSLGILLIIFYFSRASNHAEINSIVNLSFSDNDKVEPCASEVHENCVKHWVAVFENKKLCNDFSQFMRCLHVENRKSGCKADIIRHMIALLDVVGNNIIEQIREHMDYECHDNQ